MQITQLDPLTYIGPQISLEDMAEMNHMGVRTIVVARPEGEESGQPEIADIRAAAGVYGIGVHQIPVTPGNVSDANVGAFHAAMSNTTGLIFVYCRSGMRATTLWALDAATQGRPVGDILQAARKASFDLTGLIPRLTERAA